MVKIIDGDLLQTDANLIVHQVNCQGKMRSGVAKQIREQFPKVYIEYMNLFNKTVDSKDLLGVLQYVEVKLEKNQQVVNMFSQENYGYDGKQYTDYGVIENCLQEIAKVAKERNLIVAMPYLIGCDRGGGDWVKVYSMLERIFDDCELILYKWNPIKV